MTAMLVLVMIMSARRSPMALWFGLVCRLYVTCVLLTTMDIMVVVFTHY